MAILLPPSRLPRIAYKNSASPLTTGTLWTYTGGIQVFGLLGIIRTVVQAQATTVKLSIKNDALTAFDMCATLDLNAAAVGSTIHLPAAVASAAVKTVGGAFVALQLRNTPITAICTTSGIVTVTYGAASTGAIDWYMQWEPAVPNASVV